MNSGITARFLFACGILACGLLAGRGALAGKSTLREYPTGGAALLVIAIEESWKDGKPPAGSGASISIESKEPGKLHILLTPLPASVAGMPRTDDEVRAAVQATAESLGPKSVEKKLEVVALRGPEVKGYGFHATDPAPRAGDFRFMHNGLLSLGAVMVPFTVLYNPGAENEAKAALAALREMRLAQKKPTAP
jgi:hypothetical protein